MWRAARRSLRARRPRTRLLIQIARLADYRDSATGSNPPPLDMWASHWNDDPQPFAWTKTVDDIITKVKRGRATLDHLTESATHHERIGGARAAVLRRREVASLPLVKLAHVWSAELHSRSRPSSVACPFHPRQHPRAQDAGSFLSRNSGTAGVGMSCELMAGGSWIIGRWCRSRMSRVGGVRRVVVTR